MRNLTQLLCFLPLLHLHGLAVADGNGLLDSFGPSIEGGCVQGFVKKAVADYSKMTGIAPENIPANVRAQLEETTRPLHTVCNCLARKISARVQSESDKKIEIAVDLGGLSSAAECAPAPNTLGAVQRSFMRLVGASPPPVSSLKTERAPFTVELTLNNSHSRPSVFAAYTRPPESLTRLVFLAPGTGIACKSQNICVDQSPLEIVEASELLASQGRFLGKEGSQNLQRLIEQFGDARVITSGSNFANFAINPQGATYAVRYIDGIPIEKTTVGRVWLVVFASKMPTDPRAPDFSPAIASVYEVEFVD